MDGLEEIKKIIKNFIYESKETKKQITEIENKRTVLAQERNEKKQNNVNNYAAEINVLGKQISELGNRSQELQNKLDFKFNETKKIVNLTIDNFITDEIRNIRKMDEEKQELETKLLNQTGKDVKYEIRKQEFFERFGRIPELSVKAQMKEKVQEKQIASYKKRTEELESRIEGMEKELADLASIKRNFKNKKWNSFIENSNIEKVEEQTIKLPLIEEEFKIEEVEPIEYVGVKEFEIEEKTQIGEIEIEQEQYQKIEKEEEKPIDEIEMLARAIVEEIILEQAKNSNEQEIITFEEKKEETKIQKTVEEKATLLNIIAKIEDGEIVYKAQISNGEDINVYPTLEVKNILLNDKEYREEIKESLVNYAIEEHKILDNNVIKKIDPTICEILEKFAKKYDYNEKKLIYDYAMSFSKNEENEIYSVTPITYNLAYLKNTNLSQKEKKTISKICKKAVANENIDIIGGITGFGKIKYIIKKIFNINSVKALPEGKY